MNEKIILAGGCFWCTEAVFSLLDGIKKITPGYIGGNTKNPTYEEVCTGTTNHAEAIEVEYDSKVISTVDILRVFFATQDRKSTRLNSSHVAISYAVFCLKKKKNRPTDTLTHHSPRCA